MKERERSVARTPLHPVRLDDEPPVQARAGDVAERASQDRPAAAAILVSIDHPRPRERLQPRREDRRRDPGPWRSVRPTRRGRRLSCCGSNVRAGRSPWPTGHPPAFSGLRHHPAGRVTARGGPGRGRPRPVSRSLPRCSKSSVPVPSRSRPPLRPSSLRQPPRLARHRGHRTADRRVEGRSTSGRPGRYRRPAW